MAALAHGVLAAPNAAPARLGRPQPAARSPQPAARSPQAAQATRRKGKVTDIRAATVLPARRTPITLATADGLNLVGELALPQNRDPAATLVCLHPLPTGGGMMDSHLYRKAANRLPALADLAVLRFNTRGTESERGRSDGEFGGGDTEKYDVEAAVAYAMDAGLPRIYLLGWSFGTELTLRWGLLPGVEGGILLSPPLKRAGDEDLDRWALSGRPLTVLVPELDDYLRPDEARQRFARVPKAELIAVDGAKHLWVGENYVRIVLSEIVRVVNPAALGDDSALPATWADER
jgi:alpha/beta superfamily hydrolase